MPSIMPPTRQPMTADEIPSQMMSVRLIMSSLQVAGAVIAQQMGLGFVTAVDPTLGQQGAIVGNFLAMLGVTLIFATDLHHLVMRVTVRFAQIGDRACVGRPVWRTDAA